MSSSLDWACTAALAAALLSLGCQRSDSDAGDERAPTGAEARQDPDEPAEAESEGPSVELLSAGSEPRRELRYELTPGTRERITIELDMEMTMELGDEPSPPVQLPRMQMILDLTIEEELDDAARYSFTLAEATALEGEDADPAVLRAIEQGLAQTVGTQGGAVVNERGLNRDTHVQIPDSAPAKTRQMMQKTAQQMEQLASPLPEEPVGEGARWEVTQHLEQNGISLVQTSVMTLESFEGRTGQLTASIEQDADRQSVQLPGQMQGASAELLELRSRGDGEIAFDLENLMPVRSEMHTETDSRYRVDVGGGTQPMSMTMDLALDMKASEP